jgi:hypothetical protein
MIVTTVTCVVILIGPTTFYHNGNPPMFSANSFPLQAFAMAGEKAADDAVGAPGNWGEASWIIQNLWPNFFRFVDD